MPIIWAGIASLIAKTHGAAVLAKNECLFAALMQPQWVRFTQINAIMRCAKCFDNFRRRVSRTDSLSQAPTTLGKVAALCHNDPERLK